MKTLTERQAEVLRFIMREIEKSQRPPTLREICAHLVITGVKGAQWHLQALEEKGFIACEGNNSKRSIRVLRNTLNAPVKLEFVGEAR